MQVVNRERTADDSAHSLGADSGENSIDEAGFATLAIFCKVIDNYGDIGICWRLARQLVAEHGIAVTLWVDDLQSFQRLCPQVMCDFNTQRIAGVQIRLWHGTPDACCASDVADIVIEFFGCDIPESYINAMASCNPQPVWLNLEGLTAEKWVEGCHTLPSPHPCRPLTKYFFFPGFNRQTGGLLHEAGLHHERIAFQSTPGMVEAFLGRYGVTLFEAHCLKVSLFCYPHAPVPALFETWQLGTRAITCLVPEGVAVEAVHAFLGTDPVAGVARTRDALTVRVLPFLPQQEYDRLLWACDLNFVRGEDSFVRAQWAGRAFIWHIYPQAENLHHVKLRAFLERFAEAGPAEVRSLKAATLEWNGASAGGIDALPDWPDLWRRLEFDLDPLADRTEDWERHMLAHGDLSSNLLKFAAELRLVLPDNRV